MEEKVLLERNLFRIILDHALDIDTLSENHKLLYTCSLVCKKWRLIIFKLLVSHFKIYNYKKKQFDFDNIISCCRIVERKYFESDANNPYKNPHIKMITKYRLTNPKHYLVLVSNSDDLKQKHKVINARFHKISNNKICVICSTIVQARTVCGIYLKKIRQKKQALEQQARKLIINESNTTENDTGNDDNTTADDSTADDRDHNDNNDAAADDAYDNDADDGDADDGDADTD